MRVIVWLGAVTVELRSREDRPGGGARRLSSHDVDRLAAQVLRSADRRAVATLLKLDGRALCSVPLERWLAGALRRGEVTLWRREVTPASRPVGEGAEAEAEEPVAGDGASKTWIEIELLDMDGNPMAGEPYAITLPNGTVREGALDGQGRAYFGGLDPGEAEVRWPSRDGDATAPDAPLGQDPLRAQPQGDRGGASRDERHWVEFELLDMEDRPMANERYGLRLPDGVVRYGWLDENGAVTVEGLAQPGDCAIWFPERDEASIDAVPDGTAPAGDHDAMASQLTQASSSGAARVSA